MDRIDPINFDTSDPRDETRFHCACGDESCWGFDDDPQNIRIGTHWYAADCRNPPAVVREMQERDSLADVARDDDAFNRVRR